jgi:nucleoside-diphosphate-sugar epimerase
MAPGNPQPSTELPWNQSYHCGALHLDRLHNGTMMKIFLTGHRGFIGAHLVDVLKQEGHTVVGCDLKLFEGCNWEPLVDPDLELIKDIRSIEAADLDGCDCVMHLAAISNDPMGELNAQLTFDINRDASIRLATTAKEAGVPRFLFAGSCSIYGQG